MLVHLFGGACMPACLILEAVGGYYLCILGGAIVLIRGQCHAAFVCLLSCCLCLSCLPGVEVGGLAAGWASVLGF
jgi:hypothetical protein